MNADPPTFYQALDRPEVLGLLFHPRKAAGPVDGGSRFKELRIPVAPDIGVGTRFYMGQHHQPVILFFHGNGEIVADYDDIAPLFNRLGVSFIAADYRGYGCSDGYPTVAAMMADCHVLFDFICQWLQEERFSGPLMVMGRSLGSASALELAATHGEHIDGLIIESGFARTQPLLRLLGIDPQRIGFSEPEGFINRDKIRAFTGPTLIIHAEFDHIIPFGDGQALFDASGATDKVLLKIPGANHNDIFMRGMDAYLSAIAKLAGGLMGAEPV